MNVLFDATYSQQPYVTKQLNYQSYGSTNSSSSSSRNKDDVDNN